MSHVSLLKNFFLIGTQFLLTLIGNSQQKELIVIPHQKIFLNDVTSKIKKTSYKI